MSLSAISMIVNEGQPQGLSSFIRSGVAYVVWTTTSGDTKQKRLNWKPHNAAMGTELLPNLAAPFVSISSVLDPVTDSLLVVWDDGGAVDGVSNGLIYYAKFNPLTGAIITQPTAIFQGSQPKLCYKTKTINNSFLMYYRTQKNGGVYGRSTYDGGSSWSNAYPLITGRVTETSALEVVPFDANRVSVAQLGAYGRDFQCKSTASISPPGSATQRSIVASFMSPALTFTAVTSGSEYLKVYNGGTLLLTTKATNTVNWITAVPHPSYPLGAKLLVSLVDRFCVLRYVNASTPLIVEDDYRVSVGSFYQSIVLSNGVIIVAVGAYGVLALNPSLQFLGRGKISDKVVSSWAPSTVYSLSSIVKPKDSSTFARNRYYFTCSVAGTSGTSEPAWKLSGAVIDNTAQWSATANRDGNATCLVADEGAETVTVTGTVGGLGVDGRSWVFDISRLF